MIASILQLAARILGYGSYRNLPDTLYDGPTAPRSYRTGGPAASGSGARFGPSRTPAEAQVLETIPVRSCVRRGAAIDLVLDRGREHRSQFVFTTARAAGIA